MQLLAYNSRFNVFPYRRGKFQVTNKRLDKRYETDFERIGVFNSLVEALRYIERMGGK